MKSIDLFQESTSSVASRPTRFLLSTLGVLVGVASFVTIGNLVGSAQSQIASRFDALVATDIRLIRADPEDKRPLDLLDAESQLMSLNGVKTAGLFYPVAPAFGPDLEPRTLSFQNGQANEQIEVIAASPGALVSSAPSQLSGSLYNAFHNKQGARVAVVGKVAAERLSLSPIDEQPTIFLAEIPYLVIGVVGEVEQHPELLVSIAIPPATEMRDFGTADPDIEVWIKTQPGAAELIARQGPIAVLPSEPNRLLAVVPPDARSLKSSVQTDFSQMYLTLGLVTFFVSVLSITGMTLLSMSERRSEFGLRRSLGASRVEVAAQVCIETLLIATVGVMLGTSAGIVFVRAFCEFRHWTFILDRSTVLAGMQLGIAAGVLSGLAPSIIVARIPPAITLRS